MATVSRPPVTVTASLPSAVSIWSSKPCVLVLDRTVRVGQDRIRRRAGLEREHLDTTHRRATQIGELHAGLVEIDADSLRCRGERLVGLPAVVTRTTIDDVDALAGDQVVVAAAAAHLVVAVARADAVVAAAGTNDKMLDAAEIETVVVAPVVPEIDSRIARFQRAGQRDAADAIDVIRFPSTGRSTTSRPSACRCRCPWRRNPGRP